MKQLACLGPSGTFSELAARNYLKQKGKSLDIEFCQTIDDVLTSIEEQKVKEAIVPVENSVEGAVNETLDYLAKSKNIRIITEYILDIHNHLIGYSGIDLAQVKTVYSHPQPIAQCKKFLRETIPHAEVKYTFSTAAAIKKVAEFNDKTSVAIGGEYSIDKYGLVVLKKSIADVQNNQTRFFVMNSKDIQEKGHKVSLVFATEKDIPGSLYRILKEFADSNINLTKIESRPSKEFLGHYLFFVDFQGNLSMPEVRQSLENIKELTTFLKILGVYEVIGS